MDAIFGRKNFRNDIVWRRATAHNDAHRYGSITDHILYYAKGDRPYWSGDAIATPKTEEQLRAAYPSQDDHGRFRSDNLTGAGTTDGESGSVWRGYDVGKRGRHWAVPRHGPYAAYIEQNFIPGYRRIKGVQDRLNALDTAGLIHHPQRGFWPGLKRYAEADTGIPPQNLILEPIGFTNFSAGRGEHTGYATQKPVALYERFIQASSREDDIVLDPFAGCATTCVAAERLGRQWVGIDIWDKAHETVIQRLQQAGLAAPDASEDERLLTFGDITYSTTPPVRTDAGEEAVPFLQLQVQVASEPWARLSRGVMTNVLVEAQRSGDRVICAGCGRALEREFMQLDHKLPRKDGGENHIMNRILLCGPCNRKKGANLTLSGLVKANGRDGWMVDKPLAESSQTRAQAEAERIRRLTPPELAEVRRRFG